MSLQRIEKGKNRNLRMTERLSENGEDSIFEFSDENGSIST